MADLSANNLIKPKILHRAHVKKKLEDIFRYPLFFVISSMGFGKTTAVRDMLRKKRKIKYIWFTFEREETEDIWLWVRFCKTLEKTNAQLGKKLFESGMPHSQFEMERVVSLINTEMEMETVVVFDDMQLCHSENIHEIIRKLALAGIPMLHFVLISRINPKMDVDKLVEAGKAQMMTQKNFEFSKTECEDFFILNDAPLTEAEVDVLYDKTDGWTSELYLALMHYLRFKDFNNMKSGTLLMKSAIYNRLDKQTQTSLLKLSKISSFSLDQAEFITKDRGIRDTIKRLYENNCFTKYDEEVGMYGFHAMLWALLDQEFAVSGMSPKPIYEAQGDWCLAVGDRIGAINAYTKCKDYDRILDIMAERFATNLMSTAPNIVVRAFDRMDEQTRLSNPVGYLTYIYSYSLIVDIKKGAEMLKGAKEYYQQRDNLEDRAQIFGEIALIESLTAYNDLKKMFECYERANDYFDGGTSLIFNANVMITFGVPLTMFLYHKEPGDMKGIVELTEEEFWIFNHIANGCGAGFEYLIRAESEYMTGNFEKAEMIAYKAIYKAKTKEQCGIILSASFLLVRIAFFTGRVREVDDILLQMMQEVEKDGSPIMLGCYEFILGYVYSYMGKIDLIPQWLLSGDIYQKKIMAPARYSGFLIVGKIICEQNKPEKLLDHSIQMQSVFAEKENLIGVMVAKVYEAIAVYHLSGTVKAAEVMQQALDMAEPDDAYVILAENTSELIPILEAIDSSFGNKVLEKARGYLASKQIYRDKQKNVPLTKREREVMDLVCDGYTAEAIAKILFVSHSTVKKHIAAAYDKLGVNKKADAIAAYKNTLNR